MSLMSLFDFGHGDNHQPHTSHYFLATCSDSWQDDWLLGTFSVGAKDGFARSLHQAE